MRIELIVLHFCVPRNLFLSALTALHYYMCTEKLLFRLLATSLGGQKKWHMQIIMSVP